MKSNTEIAKNNKGGRKPKIETEIKNKVIGFRVLEKDFLALDELFKKSTFTHKSDFYKAIFYQAEVKIITESKELIGIKIELSELENEVGMIGKNINMVVKKMQSTDHNGVVYQEAQKLKTHLVSIENNLKTLMNKWFVE